MESIGKAIGMAIAVAVVVGTLGLFFTAVIWMIAYLIGHMP